jgi:O-antigen/teichoic acid export membrane protein
MSSFWPVKSLREMPTFVRQATFRATRSQFVRRTSSLMLYTVISQLITVVSSLFLARIYSPSEFGLYGVLFSFTAIVGNTISLNYDFAIPSPKEEVDAVRLVAGAAIIAMIMSLLMAVMFLVLVVTNQMKLGELPAWSWLLAWAMLLSAALSSTLQYWAVRQQRLHLLGEGGIALSASRAGAQIVLGLLTAGKWPALAVAETIGRLILLARYLPSTWRDFRALSVTAPTGKIWNTLLRFRRFPTVLLPPMVMDAALSSISVPVLNVLYGLTLTGQYWLMRRVLDLPVSFISKTIGDAFHGKISEYARTDPARVQRLIVGLFGVLLILAGVAASPLILFGPSIFRIVFGKPWSEAGMLAAVTAPSMIVNIATGPVARAFAITRRANLRYAFTAVNLIGCIIVFSAAWLYHLSILWTATGLSIVYFLSYCVYFVSAYIAAGQIAPEGIPEGDA